MILCTFLGWNELFLVFWRPPLIYQAATVATRALFLQLNITQVVLKLELKTCFDNYPQTEDMWGTQHPGCAALECGHVRTGTILAAHTRYWQRLCKLSPIPIHAASGLFMVFPRLAWVACLKNCGTRMNLARTQHLHLHWRFCTWNELRVAQMKHTNLIDCKMIIVGGEWSSFMKLSLRLRRQRQERHGR